MKPKLTPEIHKSIVSYVAAGNFFSTACELTGVSVNTAGEWLARGRGKSTRKADEVYVKFAQDVDKAVAQGEAAAVLRIRNAAQGGTEVKAEVVEKFDKDGNLIQRTERKELQPPNWTADAWFLERRFPERWNPKHKVELTGKDDGPVEVKDVSEAKETLAAKLATIKKRQSERPEGI